MNFTILRLLRQSELGMFHEYRRLGKETAKQRAVTFDWDVVDRVFPAAKDSERIPITCRMLEDRSTPVVKDQWLKKQGKNWRLEGHCPRNSYYGFVEPGVLFAMVVDASETPATASWAVVPIDHPARAAILNHGESAGFRKSATIALWGEEGDACRSILTSYFPLVFGRRDTVAATQFQIVKDAKKDHTVAIRLSSTNATSAKKLTAAGFAEADGWLVARLSTLGLAAGSRSAQIVEYLSPKFVKSAVLEGDDAPAPSKLNVRNVTDSSNTESESGDIAPDPVGLVKILARAGHSLPSAVADLVDNSLSHGSSRIDITFPNPNAGGRWLCVRDDGLGMTPTELRQAMKIGHQRAYGDAELGKYGYGLKGAAWSQADCLTVVSKARNLEKSHLTWDTAHLARTQKWEPLTGPVDPKYKGATKLGPSGTAVLLTQMRPPVEAPKVKGVEPYSQEIASIRNHLELVFHRFLEGKVPGREKVTITLNGQALSPNNPMGHPLTKANDPRSIELAGQSVPSNSAIVTVRAYITPNESELESFYADRAPLVARSERDRHTLGGRANDAQGLYFYRLHRLIKWGGWEGLFTNDEHTKLLRVSVDFDRAADEQLQVDISKQLVRLPFAINEELRDILKGPRVEARNRYDKKAKDSGGKSAKGAKTSGGSNKSKGQTKDADTTRSERGEGDTGASKGDTDTSKKTSTLPKKEKTTVRLVEGGTFLWERKSGFSGEQVEVTDRIPALATLVQTIEKDSAAKSALSEFLRVLEQADVVKLLAGKPDEQ